MGEEGPGNGSFSNCYKHEEIMGGGDGTPQIEDRKIQTHSFHSAQRLQALKSHFSVHFKCHFTAQSVYFLPQQDHYPLTRQLCSACSITFLISYHLSDLRLTLNNSSSSWGFAFFSCLLTASQIGPLTDLSWKIYLKQLLNNC